MRNLFERLAEWAGVKRPEPFEFAPRLSKAKEDAMIKVLDTRSALLRELSIDNYCDAKKAEYDMWLSDMDDQMDRVNSKPNTHASVDEGLSVLYPNKEAK